MEKIKLRFNMRKVELVIFYFRVILFLVVNEVIFLCVQLVFNLGVLLDLELLLMGKGQLWPIRLFYRYLRVQR